MAEIIEKRNKTWQAITFPDGADEEYDDVDKDYDEKCDKSFDKMFDRIINFCYGIFFVFSIISLYFFVTREIL